MQLRKQNAEAQQYVVYKLGRLAQTTRASAIYSERNVGSKSYYHVPPRYYLFVREMKKDWYGVVMSDGRTGWVPAKALRLTTYEVVYNLPRGVDPNYITQLAMRYIGVRYRWGGNSPKTGLDCSGFVKLIYEQAGIKLPRTAREQALKGAPIHRIEDLRPGDRLYFSVKRKYIDHTGLYLGDGYFIHSSSSRGGVDIDHISRPLYRQSLVAARR
jgi:cell wall-associated NlpC family hydrolase